jgi:hypothetical protein
MSINSLRTKAKNINPNNQYEVLELYKDIDTTIKKESLVYFSIIFLIILGTLARVCL